MPSGAWPSNSNGGFGSSATPLEPTRLALAWLAFDLAEMGDCALALRAQEEVSRGNSDDCWHSHHVAYFGDSCLFNIYSAVSYGMSTHMMPYRSSEPVLKNWIRIPVRWPSANASPALDLDGKTSCLFAPLRVIRG